MSLPPPAAPLRCNNPDCTLPSGGRCARIAEFSDPLASCVELARDPSALPALPSKPEPEPAQPATPEVRTAWSGRALTPIELDRLMWRSPARLLAVIGTQNAGKTCLLTATFLEIAQGQRRGLPYRFAGSRSLTALHELIHRAAAWTGDDSKILEYTKVSEADDPQLFLHLALRPEAERDDRMLDVLLTDVPGEWLEHHAQVVDETSERRLEWIARADALVVLADASEIAKPQVDNKINRLLQRMIDTARQNERPPRVALVFTKFDLLLREHSDLYPPTGDDVFLPDRWGPLARARRTWGTLDRARRDGVDIRPFAVSAFPTPTNKGHPVGVMTLFTWIMAGVDRRPTWMRYDPPVPEGASCFQAVRRRSP